MDTQNIIDQIQQNEYTRVLQRMETLPAAQKNLPTDWSLQTHEPSNGMEASYTKEEVNNLLEAMEAKIKQSNNVCNQKIEITNQTLKTLQDQIKNLQSKNNTEDSSKPTKPTYLQAAQSLPALNMDLDGNKLGESYNKETPEPLDLAAVKTARVIHPPRPNLSTSTHMEAAVNLLKHNEETAKQLENNEIKLKKQSNMSRKEKDKTTEEMLAKSSTQVGIAPITKKQLYRLCDQMTKKGILKSTEEHKTRLQRTLKSMVKTWTKKYLKMDDEDWQELQITSIQQTQLGRFRHSFPQIFQPRGSDKTYQQSKEPPPVKK